jgi:4-amino-4-deoxy-L-arabinose transferase-like glycosyltransferase
VLRRILLVVGAIAALGLALRIWYLLVVVGDSSLAGDGLEYHGLARNLADGRGFVSPLTAPGEDPFPTAHKPPLYPLLLALVSTLGGTGYVAHQVATAVVGTATVVVCALLAYRVAGARAAIIAAALGAAYPVFLVADASLRAESLFALLVALALLASYRAWESPTAWRLCQLGVVVGLAALTRSEGLALLVLLAVPVGWRRGGPGRDRRLAVVAAACALTLAPWLIRCWIVFDEPVAISTSYGDLIAGANCDTTYFGPMLGSWSFDCVLGETGEDEAAIARRLRARGLRYAREHADRLPAVIAARVLRPWGLYDPDGEARLKTLGEGRSETANWIGLGAAWTLMLLAPLGLLVLRRRNQPLFILVAPFVLVLFVSVTAYGILRFRAPADVSLIVLGAVALDAYLPGRRTTARAVTEERRLAGRRPASSSAAGAAGR